MLWRKSYATSETRLAIPSLTGKSLGGKEFQPSDFDLWILGPGTPAEFLRYAGVWNRLLADAFPTGLRTAVGLLKTRWEENAAAEIRPAVPESQHGHWFLWNTDWTSGAAVVSLIPATGDALVGPPTEDAWERFQLKLISALSGRR